MLSPSHPLRNPFEYRAPPVTRSEQVSFRSSEGLKLKRLLDSLNPVDLPGVEFSPGVATRYPIPKESGVYFVFVNGALVYIGQACSIAARLRGYHNFLTPLKKTTGFYVRWLLLPRNQRLKTETYLTRRFLMSK